MCVTKFCYNKFTSFTLFAFPDLIFKFSGNVLITKLCLCFISHFTKFLSFCIFPRVFSLEFGLRSFCSRFVKFYSRCEIISSFNLSFWVFQICSVWFISHSSLFTNLKLFSSSVWFLEFPGLSLNSSFHEFVIFTSSVVLEKEKRKRSKKKKEN